MEILTDKQYLQYDYISRYQEYPTYYHSYDKKYCNGITGYINKKSNYQKYIIQEDDTLDSLALKFYKNPSLYWIIADFNNIIDAFSLLQPGATLYIPSLQSIQFKE